MYLIRNIMTLIVSLSFHKTWGCLTFFFLDTYMSFIYTFVLFSINVIYEKNNLVSLALTGDQIYDLLHSRKKLSKMLKSKYTN